MIKAIFLFALLLSVCPVMCQELEPRAYANLPVNTNVIAAVYGYSFGNVLTDPAQPIKDAVLRSHNIGLGYVHTFRLANRLARVQTTLPYAIMDGKATVNNVPSTGVRSGFGDARVRFGINLIGSPALNKMEFRQYKQQTIMGVSFVVSVPTGLYYKDKLLNLGSNRWAFKPEVGVSRRFKHVFAEAYVGAWFYTNNTAYLSNKIQKQEPIVTIQGHASYYFKNQMWFGVDGNWFNGGKTIVDNVSADDLKDNWRVGATWSVPVARQHSVKLQFHVGAFTNAGYNYNLISLGYQYVFF